MTNNQRLKTNTQHSTTLVTGGTGLVGSHLLVHLVDQGKKVRAIYRDTASFKEVRQVFSHYADAPDELFDAIEWVKADILNIPALQEAFKGISDVYHCAGVVSFDSNDYDLMRRVNIEGTANMVNMALKQEVNKFCYVSSIATLDNQLKNKVITEQNIWNPANNKLDYAITKYGGEMEVWRGTQEGLNAVIVNPGVILGSGFWHKNTGMIFTRVANGFKYYTTGVTAFVGVWDVVKAMVQLMASDISNERFVVMSENLSYQTLLSAIAQAMNKPKPSVHITPLTSKILWILDSIKSFVLSKPNVLTRKTVQTAHEKIYYAADKIEQKLSFKFEPIQNVVKRCVQLRMKSEEFRMENFE